MNDQTPMPSYENPPVIEVTCGVQFNQLRNFKSVHFGAYWNIIKDTYPLVQDASLLLPVFGIESPEGPPPPPLGRQWYIQEDESGLIQLQSDRFHYNWRKIKDEDVYPRYSKVKEEFIIRWDEFVNFIEEEKIGPIQPINYELSYVNHIFKGDLWKSVADLGDIIPILHWPSTEERFLPSPDRIEWRTMFPCPKCQGNLVISLKQGKRSTDKRSLFVLELSVHGRPDKEGRGFEEWFDVAREWIVRGFTSITSESAHKYWRRVE